MCWCELIPQSEPSPTTGTFSLASYYNGSAMRMPNTNGSSKDGNGADQSFAFKPLGVKTVSRNNISPLANLVLDSLATRHFLKVCFEFGYF